MRRLLASIMAVLLLSTAAQAQFLPRPGAGGSAGAPGSPLSGGIGASAPSAGFSPYLNLIRGGSAAVNYYGIVRPQQNMQAALQAVQQQQQAGGASFEPDDPTMPGIVVGTRVRFLNTSGYFLNLQGGTTVGASGGLGGRSGAQGNQGFASQGTSTGSGLGTGLGTGLGAFGAASGGTRGATRPR